MPTSDFVPYLHVPPYTNDFIMKRAPKREPKSILLFYSKKMFFLCVLSLLWLVSCVFAGFSKTHVTMTQLAQQTSLLVAVFILSYHDPSWLNGIRQTFYCIVWVGWPGGCAWTTHQFDRIWVSRLWTSLLSLSAVMLWVSWNISRQQWQESKSGAVVMFPAQSQSQSQVYFNIIFMLRTQTKSHLELDEACAPYTVRPAFVMYILYM